MTPKYDDMSYDHERYEIYRVGTTIRFEYDAVPIDPDADSDSDPETKKRPNKIFQGTRRKARP
jgi:hypothetical protein